MTDEERENKLHDMAFQAGYQEAMEEAGDQLIVILKAAKEGGPMTATALLEVIIAYSNWLDEQVEKEGA